ncbi:MAG TPA: sulfite oxidase-like oxidoreductase [Terriglobia bacterium]|nr:sulfite oxidase-like oxidoreductase [Terriglobia bacterium]
MGIFSSNSERKILEAKMREEGRLPPGQAATLKWPVLHLGDVPRFNPATWDFRTEGLVRNPLRLNWDEFQALPRAQVTADFHCVTRWSRFDNRWEGVPFRAIHGLTEPLTSADFVLVHGEGEYTTNVPLADLLDENVLFADRHDGAPLAPEHGGPLRLVVPKLYGWKSAKWVRSLEFLSRDEAGYWERNGYHRVGDPWKEQRFDTD